MPTSLPRTTSCPTDVALATPRVSDRNTYGQILKSSALIGGSSIINIVVSIVRAKAMALLLGPSGVGLVGLYSSIVELTKSIAGMGINSSGVRQIAEAVGSGDTQRVARTAAVLRHVSLFLGLAGAAFILIFRKTISSWTFGTDEFATPVALLSFAVLFQLIGDGQIALIQGMRRISELARISVVAGLFGTVLSLLLVYSLGKDGVVPSLVGAAAITLAVSWWHRRRIDIAAAPLESVHARTEASALLKLGSAFMASAVLTTGGAYVIRAFLSKSIGIEAAGLYQSAWTLGGLYIGFILQSMGSDFYPRLTAAANDNTECNRLVNEQAQISLLLAGPGVLATLTFAPLVIAVFYASTFAAAVEPLRWICLGMALRVIAWPMGFIVLAKGARGIIFWAELAANVVHVGLALVLARWWGLTGATMAFFGLYVWHGTLMYAIVRRLTGFRWSDENLRIGFVFLTSIAVVFGGFALLPMWAATVVGSVAVVASGVYSLRAIFALIPLDRAPRQVRELLMWTRILGSVSRLPTPQPLGEP